MGTFDKYTFIPVSPSLCSPPSLIGRRKVQLIFWESFVFCLEKLVMLIWPEVNKMYLSVSGWSSEVVIFSSCILSPVDSNMIFQAKGNKKFPELWSRSLAQYMSSIFTPIVVWLSLEKSGSSSSKCEQNQPLVCPLIKGPTSPQKLYCLS